MAGTTVHLLGSGGGVDVGDLGSNQRIGSGSGVLTVTVFLVKTNDRLEVVVAVFGLEGVVSIGVEYIVKTLVVAVLQIIGGREAFAKSDGSQINPIPRILETFDFGSLILGINIGVIG